MDGYICIKNEYTKCLTRNKADHCLGNGWTKDVIVELCKGLQF